ncbi:MAG: hypothetical protein H7Y20_15655 [Bryobacteraceae bacterium]|nr:hypothetical protein [Bryobacteraceae bacterium]
MHTRRFGAFIIGMWIMGTIVVWFARSLNEMNVERMFTNPPVPVQKEIDNMGNDTSRQIFRYQAAQHSRRIQETWEMIQLGIGAALLATSILTTHRSRVVVGSTILMMLMLVIMAFYITPVMHSLARSYDFLPASANIRERESYASSQVRHSVLEILKLALMLLVAARLLFDFYDFGAMLPFSKGQKKRRRLRTTRPPSVRLPEADSSNIPLENATGALPEPPPHASVKQD